MRGVCIYVCGGGRKVGVVREGGGAHACVCVFVVRMQQ